MPLTADDTSDSTPSPQYQQHYDENRPPFFPFTSLLRALRNLIHVQWDRVCLPIHGTAFVVVRRTRKEAHA